ncbi:MAG: hypothetical protein N2513_06730 [Deltaproteobacteria bacterium]|nr:hypothetical protein [Deltaproteobacteria bacterium]
MKNISFLFVLILLVYSCASGPVYMATVESEAIKTQYASREAVHIHISNEKVIKEIYSRFSQLGINFVKDGLGIMPIKDEHDKTLYYLMVFIRPKEIRFDVNTTDPEKRLSEIVYIHLRKYLSHIKRSDVKDLDGLSFGLYWPVRDFSQCKEYGGFIEYAHFNIPKDELYSLLDGKKETREVLKVSEIIVSLNLEPPKSVRIEF